MSSRVCARALACLLPILLGACGGGGGGGEAPPPVAGDRSYLPSAAGSAWHYTEGISRIAVRSSGPNVFAGFSGDLLRTEDADGTRLNETLIVRQSGETWAVPVSGHDPLTVAIGAIKLFGETTPGSRFVQLDRNIDADLDGDGVPERIAARSEVVVVDNGALETPAGRYASTLHLRTSTTLDFSYSGGGGTARISSTENAWYAAGVGLVRRDVDVPGFSPLQRLLQRYVVEGRRSESVAPSILSVSPQGSQPTRYPVVTVQFSEPMDASTSCAALSVADEAGRAVAGRCRVIDDRLEFELGVSASGSFTATVASTATDLVGNRLPAERRWQFVLDTIGPTLLSTNVTDGAVDVPLETVFVLRFSQPIDPATFSSSAFKLGPDFAPSIGIDVSLDGATITIQPRQPLERGTRYTLIVPGTLSDLSGNPLDRPYFITFMTDQGGFGVPQPLFAEAPLVSISASALADVNNDGRSDVIFFTGAGQSSYEFSLVVRLQRADGSLSTPAVYAGAFGECRSVSWMEMADFDKDGRVDVALGGDSSCPVRWMKQQVDGSFVVAGNITTLNAPSGRVIDLDRDGHPELLLNLVQRLEIWRLNAGEWQQAIPAIEAPVGAWSDVAAGDLTGDGWPDIALLGSTPEGHRLLVLKQSPLNVFAATSSVAFGNGSMPNRLDLLDVNGDGLLDAAATSSFFPDTQLVIQQPGGLSSPTPLAVGSARNGVLAVDIDGDARTDLVSATYGLAGVHLRRSDGSLAPERSYGILGGSGAIMRPGAADLNGDGRVDLLVGTSILYQKTSKLPDLARGRALGGVAASSVMRR